MFVILCVSVVSLIIVLFLIRRKHVDVSATSDSNGSISNKKNSGKKINGVEIKYPSFSVVEGVARGAKRENFDDTLPLDDLFKTMSIKFVRDDASFDFGLRRTKK